MSSVTRLWLLLSVLIVGGCAAGSAVKGVYVSENKVFREDLKASGQGELQINRADAFLQRFATLSIAINGEEKAGIANGSSVSIFVPAGTHRIDGSLQSLDMKSGCGFEFSIEPGETIVINAVPNGGGAVLPIVSIIANPLTCKFQLNPQ